MAVAVAVSLAALPPLSTAAAAAPGLPCSVAVFDEPHFPYWGTYCGLTPPDVAAYLRELGIGAELLDSRELADPTVLSAERFCALVHLYGNQFPVAAADSLRRFHQGGGGLISTGVPYCHPCRQVGGAGWTFVRADSDLVERTTDGAWQGAACLRLHKDSAPNWTGAYTSRLPAKPGAKYVVSGWVRTAGAPGSDVRDVLYLRFFGRGGEFITQAGPPIPRDVGEWRRIAREVEAPEGAETMDVCVAFWGSPGTVWLDGVGLSLSDGPNLVAEGGVEAPGGEWIDDGHEQAWMRHDRLGSGEFHTPSAERGPLTYHADADPLALGLLDWPRWARAWEARHVSSQALDSGLLPPEDEVASVVDFRDGDRTCPIIALIRHRCAGFPGAVDAWVGGHLFGHIGYYDPVDLREVIARAAIAVAVESGRLPPSARRTCLRRADRLYRRDKPPTGIPATVEPKPFPGLFPTCPRPARELIVADLRFRSLSEQLLLTSLQGLVNRRQPRLYFILSMFPATPNPDERWLAWLQEHGDIDAIRRVDDPLSLLDEFRDAYRGYVIPDADVPATVNVATMLAATQSLLIGAPPPAGPRTGTVLDLQGRWKTNAEALEWAVGKLWPRMNHHLLAYNAPDWPHLIDYLVAHKAFSFWITGPVDGRPPNGAPLPEQLVIERLLAKAPPNIGCLGAPYNGVGVGIGEGPGVALLSRYAKFLSWSAQTANLSLHSGTGPALPPSPERRGAGGEASLDPTKVYLTLLVSDGDAPVNWCGFFASRYWDDPTRGTFPLTWSLGPSMADLAPDVMAYYQARANTNDGFVAACSGAGYCYPDAFGAQYREGDALFREYLQLTGQTMERLDLRGVWTHTATGGRLRAFAEQVPSVAYLLPDYGRLLGVTAAEANGLMGRNVPFFRALTTFNPALGEQATRELMLRDIREYTPARRPAFMHVFVQCYPWSPTQLRSVLDELGPEYVPVRADDMAALYLEAER